MANTFQTPAVIAKRALATLYNSTVFAGLVHRDFDAEFNGAVGDTISVRKPATFVANEFDRDEGIDVQNATEDKFDVSLDTILDVSVAVTTEDLELEIEDFTSQIINPAMEAIVQKVDGDLAALVASTALGGGGGGTIEWDGSEARSIYTGAEGAVAKFQTVKAPRTQRHAVYSPAGEGILLEDELFVKANESGSTDALRDASIGRLFGFDNYGSNALGDGEAAEVDGLAFHRDAVALVSRPLKKPRGLSSEQYGLANFKGLGLRSVIAYDNDRKEDVLSLDILVGYGTVREEMAHVIDLGVAGS